MAEFATIPKSIPARNSIEYKQKIPKIIWQTINTNRVPVYMKSFADSWINLNPEYEYRFHDDDDIIKFIQTDFPQYIDAYKNLKYGASKADLWRYLIIYKYGGVYSDMDCRCLNSLREWIDPNADFVTQLGINKDICQWLIISVANNPIFLKAAEKTLHNSEKNNSSASYYGFEYNKNKLQISSVASPFHFNHPVLGLSGPPVLQEAAEELFKAESTESLFASTQIICVSDVASCQMNGNVIHDTRNPEYQKSCKALKLAHYNTRIERIKRKFKKLFKF